jgi:GNAT superfamily N-acetyltransferase
MTDDDLPFVETLYASTRTEELAQAGWPTTLREHFLKQQNDAQHRHYRATYTGADWLIVERAGAPIGRLYLLESEQEYRIVDISLLPELRGEGLGKALISDVVAGARIAGKNITLHVERTNPARRLYARLGFAEVEDKGVYLRMEWKPSSR